MTARWWLKCWAFAGAMFWATALAAQETPAEGTGGATTGETLVVKKAPFKIEVAATGILEALQMSPIRLKPEAWSTFTVEQALPHGSQVKTGDQLVSFDPKPLTDALVDMEAAQVMAEMALKLSQEELAAQEAAQPHDLAAAERLRNETNEALDYFLKVSRPLMERSSHFDIKQSEEMLAYAQEELKQLEKMYAADDLTEETEEIILRRARADVERAQFYAEQTRIYTERELTVYLPQLEQAARDAARVQESMFRQAQLSIPLALTRARFAAEKSVRDTAASAEHLEKHRRDRALLTLTAPCDGIVYYGECTRGRWASAESDGQFDKGTSVASNSVVMTIVQPRPLLVRVAVAEKDLQNVVVGAGGRASAVAFPQLRLTASVESVASVPSADGTFEAMVAIDLPQDNPALLPGMNCSLTIVGYNRADAITVPTSAVFTDEADGQTRYVYRVGADGAHQRANVEIGRQSDTHYEILQGLLEGDTVLLAKPE